MCVEEKGSHQINMPNAFTQVHGLLLIVCVKCGNLQSTVMCIISFEASKIDIMALTYMTNKDQLLE